MKKYKILSLDGGGSWAVLQAMALKDIYSDKAKYPTCKSILQEFDMVVANSGGSLVLAAMLCKDDMEDVINLFKDTNTRNKVFSPLTFSEEHVIDWLTKLIKIGPRYKTSRKIEGLRNVLGSLADTRLENIPSKVGIKADLMIMAYDYDKNKASYFRSNTNSSSSSTNAGEPNEVTLAQAVHASSNAPINYFDEPAQFLYQRKDRRYWDGAIGGNNNPCLAGVIEALANGNANEDIEVLSIGTGNTLMPIYTFSDYECKDYDFLMKPKAEQSLLNDIAKQASTILNEPPDVASYMSHIILKGSSLIGTPPRITRMNPLISPVLIEGKWNLPPDFDFKIFKDLITLDMDATLQPQVDMIMYLGNKWLENKVKNQAIRCDGNTLECQIGFPTYSEAKNNWLNK